MFNTPKKIDLHTHTYCSDGSMSPTELVRHAKEQGVSAIAITDHDTIKGINEGLEAGEKYGVEVIPAVEFSSQSLSQVHVLGYYIDINSPSLLKVFAEQQEERKISNQKYLKVLAEHGFVITDEEVQRVAPHGGVGRAHYAKIMMEHGWVSSVKEAFDLYLGVGMPCYIEREVITPEKAIEIIHNAGGLAFFAHPHQTKLPEDKLYQFIKHLKNNGLDGIEGYYTEYTPEMQERFLSIAKELDLLVSGGSDFHAQMKPHIQIGTGTGNLNIDYSVLEKIKSKKFTQDKKQ